MPSMYCDCDAFCPSYASVERPWACVLRSARPPARSLAQMCTRLRPTNAGSLTRAASGCPRCAKCTRQPPSSEMPRPPLSAAARAPNRAAHAAMKMHASLRVRASALPGRPLASAPNRATRLGCRRRSHACSRRCALRSRPNRRRYRRRHPQRAASCSCTHRQPKRRLPFWSRSMRRGTPSTHAGRTTTASRRRPIPSRCRAWWCLHQRAWSAGSRLRPRAPGSREWLHKRIPAVHTGASGRAADGVGHGAVGWLWA